MPPSTPLLLPIRVTACALDPDAMPAASNARATPHKWSWSAPDYAGFKPPKSSKKASSKKPRKDPAATAPVAVPAKSPAMP